MTIFRVQHNKNYTCINNTITRDPRISMKAQGIWLYAFSRPDDWSFHVNEISKHCTDGRDAILSGLKELENCGYLVRSQKHNKDGTFGDADWVFYEVPQTRKSYEQPQTENPLTDNPATANPPLLSTEGIRSTEEDQTTSVDCLSDEEQIYFLDPKAKKKTLKSVPVATIRACLQSYDQSIIDEVIVRMHKAKEIAYPEQYAVGIADNIVLEMKQKKETRYDFKPKGKSVRRGDPERRGVFANGEPDDGPATSSPMEFWRSSLS